MVAQILITNSTKERYPQVHMNIPLYDACDLNTFSLYMESRFCMD